MTRIGQANAIIEDYQAQGYELTLRQLYYQFVSRDLIANNMKEYKNLGSIINDGRLAGLIDWDAIVDRTRNLQSLGHWTNPQEIVDSCAAQFRLDKWATQECYIEVWVEKDALIGVIEKAANKHDLPYFSCRGYTSQSELWAAGRRIKERCENGKTPIVIHLGDHDPSGKDMTRDINDRLRLFAEQPIKVERIALNRDQIDEYNPPPNPAKMTDSRATGYVAEFGDESWELDALAPNVIEGLIDNAVAGYLDADEWDRVMGEQDEHRRKLKGVADNWTKLTKKL